LLSKKERKKKFRLKVQKILCLYTNTISGRHKNHHKVKNKLLFPVSFLVLDADEQKVGIFNAEVINYTWINNIYTAELFSSQSNVYTAW